MATKDEGQAVLESFAYTYDNNDQIISYTHVNNLPEEGKKIDETRVYTYDDHGNLTGSIKTYNDESGMQSETTYTYDNAGNRLAMQMDDELTEYEYNGLNQLVSMSSGDASTEYTYDDRGNQIKEETTVSVDTGQDESEVSTVTTEMEYAVTGEMISLTKSDGSTTTLTQENVYNQDGIRISREENGVKREYYYDSGVVAYTIDGSDISSVNILSPEGSAIGTYRGDDYYTYLNDIQGSTTNLVKSDGSLAAAYDYTDFGETTEITASNFDNQVCYTGGIYDEETELYYLNARYYDPATGRFISQDTYRGEMNDPGQWHLYAYCANNPINYVDPSGHKKVLITLKTQYCRSFAKIDIKGEQKGLLCRYTKKVSFTKKGKSPHKVFYSIKKYYTNRYHPNARNYNFKVNKWYNGIVFKMIVGFYRGESAEKVVSMTVGLFYKPTSKGKYYLARNVKLNPKGYSGSAGKAMLVSGVEK